LANSHCRNSGNYTFLSVKGQYLCELPNARILPAYMKLALVHQQKHESVWHVLIAVLLAIVLQLSLANKLTIGPKYIIAASRHCLLVTLAVTGSAKHTSITKFRHTLAIVLIAFISIANFSSLVLVIHSLFNAGTVTGRELIVSGLAIYLTNIIIFGLWYWELDEGDATDAHKVNDFLFPQMNADPIITGQPDWKPSFFDYLYVSVTNGTAFSPTDTLPLTHRAKLLMTLQSLIALLTIALVAARAVNILS